MQRNLAILLEIQGMELRLRELDADLAALPKRVAAIEAKLGGAQQNLSRAQAAQSGSQSERRQVDREIEALREKITKIRSHSGDVKTNQEYRALLDEIAFAEAQIAKHEERLLEIMEQADALERAAKDAAAELERQRADVQAESQAAQTHSAAVQAERATLTQSRDRLRADADDTWLRRFDRVLRMRGQALAAVDREACSGCRVRLRPQFLQEMSQQDDRLFVCESCGRILYLETSGVDVSS
ncbi:MAG TPA: C4-type zinc ribbon domain-containing protein [Terriglobales bacterium]|nr:C4-type zinc ribbon domain-containing protein [Terriglobales bacterium]